MLQVPSAYRAQIVIVNHGSNIKFSESLEEQVILRYLVRPYLNSLLAIVLNFVQSVSHIEKKHFS